MTVTGAGGFVGGHVARHLAGLGHRVVAVTRRPPKVEPGDTPVEWLLGDLRDPSVVRSAVHGARAVVHAAGWVSLGNDPKGDARRINVDVTRDLIDAATSAGVERLVYTSTLHTVATGTREAPADESTGWNLQRVDSPYARSKREAERMVMEGSDRLPGVVICPGMVLGPRDPTPTSTRVLLAMAKIPVAFLPDGGIPVVDTSVIARAHERAVFLGEPGTRYAVLGPYLSYPDLARLVGSIAGKPWRVVTIPDAAERPVVGIARLAGALLRGRRIDVSAAAAAGGFLRLHLRGDRADTAFGLVHPDPARSIRAALDDARRSGLAPWLGPLRPADDGPESPAPVG